MIIVSTVFPSVMEDSPWQIAFPSVALSTVPPVMSCHKRGFHRHGCHRVTTSNPALQKHDSPERRSHRAVVGSNQRPAGSEEEVGQVHRDELVVAGEAGL